MNWTEAKQSGLTFYETGKPCKHGHLSKRYTKTAICVECHAARTLKWHVDNPYKTNENKKLWAANNPQKLATKRKKWAQRNPDKVLAYAVENTLKRVKRVPTWLTKEDRQSIRKIYALAKELSAAYGFPWEVDHVIPLRGKTVSGLHVPSNLQIMPKFENRRKRNHYTERGL